MNLDARKLKRSSCCGVNTGSAVGWTLSELYWDEKMGRQWDGQVGPEVGAGVGGMVRSRAGVALSGIQRPMMPTTAAAKLSTK
jgi:hypothetical protein